MSQPADVMDIQNIDPRQAQPLQAFFIGAHHRVVGIIIDRLKRHRRGIAMTHHGWIDWPRYRFQQPSDFGGKNDVLARPQRITQPALGQSKTIERRAVVITKAGLFRRRQGLIRGFIR